jgi:capsular polysaccharide biosynthesis protein
MELNEAARRIFGTHLRLIAVWVIFGFVAAALLHAGSARTYTATTRLVLDTPDARDRSDSTAIADMAAAIATSPAEVRGALKDAHITTRDPVDLARHHVSVTALGSSAVLDLSVSDPNRRVAAAVSNTLAARVIQTRLKVSSGQLQQVLTELDRRISSLDRRIGDLDVQIASFGLTNPRARDAAQRTRDFLSQARGVLEAERVSLLSTDAQRPNPAIISQAPLPTHADSSRLLQDLVLGALLGLVLGIGSAGLIETIRPTFVGGDVLARELDTPLLGSLSSEPSERQRQRLVSLIAARLHLAAEGVGVHDIVLLGAGTDMELRGLAERLEAVPAEALHAVPDHTELSAAATADAPGGARARRTSAPLAEDQPRDAAGAGDRARPGMRIRAFDVHSSLVDGQSGAGIALVSPSTLAKSKLDDVRHLLNATRSPLLGLITYDGKGLIPSPRRDGTGRPSNGHRIARNGAVHAKNGAVQVRTWAKGAGARLKSLQNRAPRS